MFALALILYKLSQTFLFLEQDSQSRSIFKYMLSYFEDIFDDLDIMFWCHPYIFV
jgi:hypothetical protein